jgi:hypothetical protein
MACEFFNKGLCSNSVMVQWVNQIDCVARAVSVSVSLSVSAQGYQYQYHCQYQHKVWVNQIDCVGRAVSESAQVMHTENELCIQLPTIHPHMATPLTHTHTHTHSYMHTHTHAYASFFIPQPITQMLAQNLPFTIHTHTRTHTHMPPLSHNSPHADASTEPPLHEPGRRPFPSRRVRPA